MNNFNYLYTLGAKNKIFYWSLDKNFNITIVRDFENNIRYKNIISFEVIEGLNQYIESNWIPLANNVEKLNNGTEKYGLGKILVDVFKYSPSEAQLASHISSILFHSKVWEWNGKLRGIEIKKICDDWKEKVKIFYNNKKLLYEG